MIYLNKISRKLMNQPNNTENQETLIICNLTYFRSWHLREKVLWEVSVVIQRGFQGNFKSFIRLMTLVLYYVLLHLKFYGFPFFQHKQNTSTLILNSHDCDHSFHEWEGATGEELEERQERRRTITDVPKYKEKSLQLN